MDSLSLKLASVAYSSIAAQRAAPQGNRTGEEENEGLRVGERDTGEGGSLQPEGSFHISIFFS